MDEEKKAKYRNLINSLYATISIMNNSKKSITTLDEITEEGIKINNSNPEKEAVAFAKSAMTTTQNNLYSLISNIKNNLE